MAANLSTHLPILQVQEKAGTTPFTNAQPEKAGQTFLFGTPVQLFTTGMVQAWDGTTVANGILGISESAGLNLASDGLGAPVPPFGAVTGTGATGTYGTVPGQPAAVNIALGQPISDGRTLYMEPRESTIFQALFDNLTGAVAADYTPIQTDIGKTYGLTKDANGYWYVDKSKTAGAGCLQVVALPFGSYLNAPVNFVFLASAVQVI